MERHDVRAAGLRAEWLSGVGRQECRFGDKLFDSRSHVYSQNVYRLAGLGRDRAIQVDGPANVTTFTMDEKRRR